MNFLHPQQLSTRSNKPGSSEHTEQGCSTVNESLVSQHASNTSFPQLWHIIPNRCWATRRVWRSTGCLLYGTENLSFTASSADQHYDVWIWCMDNNWRSEESCVRYLVPVCLCSHKTVNKTTGHNEHNKCHYANESREIRPMRPIHLHCNISKWWANSSQLI